MAEALAVIGTAGAIGNIIDIVGRITAGVVRIAQTWRDAAFLAANLIAQLNAVKAALVQIQEWIDSGHPEMHYQLVMDMDASIRACGTVMEMMEEKLPELHKLLVEGSSSGRSKLRLVFSSSDVDNLQKALERQTSALNLLLTAINCKSGPDQQSLLERSSSRRTLFRVQEDSASLVVHRDTSSIRTWYTDTKSKLSRCFYFDGELFATDVYVRAVRGSVKESIRNPPASTPSEVETTLYREIYRTINECKARQSPHCRVVLQGSPSTTDCVMNELDSDTSFTNVRSAEAYRDKIREITYRVLGDVADAIRTQYANMGTSVRFSRKDFERLLQESDSVSFDISRMTVRVVECLWERAHFRLHFLSHTNYDEFLAMNYVLCNIRRIARADYMPDADDVHEFRSITGHVRRFRFNKTILDVSESTRFPKSLSMIGSFSIVIRFKTLTDYDLETLGSDETLDLQASLGMTVMRRPFLSYTFFVVVFRSDAALFRKCVCPLLQHLIPDDAAGTMFFAVRSQQTVTLPKVRSLEPNVYSLRSYRTAGPLLSDIVDYKRHAMTP